MGGHCYLHMDVSKGMMSSEVNDQRQPVLHGSGGKDHHCINRGKISKKGQVLVCSKRRNLENEGANERETIEKTGTDHIKLCGLGG